MLSELSSWLRDSVGSYVTTLSHSRSPILNMLNFSHTHFSILKLALPSMLYNKRINLSYTALAKTTVCRFSAIKVLLHHPPFPYKDDIYYESELLLRLSVSSDIGYGP